MGSTVLDREEMKAKDAMLKNFFQNVDVAVRGVNIARQLMRWEVIIILLSGAFLA